MIVDMNSIIIWIAMTVQFGIAVLIYMMIKLIKIERRLEGLK